MKRGDRVEVRWLDIHEESGDDVGGTAPAEFVTRGYFLDWSGRGKRRFLRISCSWRLDKAGEHYGCVAIPAGCVLSIRAR